MIIDKEQKPNRYFELSESECILGMQTNIFISPSNIKGTKTPKDFFYQKFRQPFKISDALIMGRASHTKVLEPEKFDKEVYVFDLSKRPEPEQNFVNSKNKAWKKEQMKTLKELDDKGITIIDSDELEIIERMDSSISQEIEHRETLLSKKYNINEVKISCIVTFDNEYNIVEYLKYSKDTVESLQMEGTKYLLLRTIPDTLSKEFNYASEYKTADSASPIQFAKDSYKHEYHLQVAMELDIIEAHYGVRPETFYFVVTEKSEPFHAECYIADPQLVDYGRVVYQKRLSHIMRSIDNKKFEGYSSIYSNENNGYIMNLSLPRWVRDYPEY